MTGVRSLSRTEAKVVLSLEADRREDVSLSELRSRAGVSAGFARKLAHDLVHKGWLQRVRRGVYLLNPSRHGPAAVPDTDPFRVGRRLATPYCFGYATAAELLGLLPQAGRVYYVVTPSPNVSAPPGPVQFRVVRSTPARFFGTRTLVRRGERLVTSDLERTVLDCVNRPEFSGGIPGAVQVLASAKRRIRWDRLGRHLLRFGNRSLALRIGYLAERVRPDFAIPPGWVRRMRARPEEPYVPLAPPHGFGRRGPHDLRWHVIRNMPTAHILGEVEIR